MMKSIVIGASGYVGAELVGLLQQHDQIQLQHLLVSEHSDVAGQLFSALHGRWHGQIAMKLQAFSQAWFEQYVVQAKEPIDAVFFATPHEFSAQWAQAFIEQGIRVFDLSGGFRLTQAALYPEYYGFEHQNTDLLAQAQYGLAEWQANAITNSMLIAVPGCYPTASLLALKPITESNLQQDKALIVINGISGVSGAGRKASLATSFYELSLSPYNILQHRHQPEISQEAHTEVIFNPHIAPYKRGLLATVTVPLKEGVSAEQVKDLFQTAYQHQPLIRLLDGWPKIDNVANTPFADIFWQVDETKQVAVISCAIDNLLKGAASQAVQCANICLGLASEYSLLPQGAMYE